MIKYQLICDQNHEFEGWFSDSAAFKGQVTKGLLRCPLCDSDQVKRALMTPNLASSKLREATQSLAADKLPATEPTPSASSRAGHAVTPGRAPVMQDEQVQAFGAALTELRQLRQKIIKDCRNVGDNFAEEARKIHYGEAEAEGIYGQATQEERESLKDEGIEIFDLPWGPSDH